MSRHSSSKGKDTDDGSNGTHERAAPRSPGQARVPNLSVAVEYYDLVAAYFQQYDYPDQERIGLILEDEWSWFSGTPSVGDW